jgi:hypothetical protein
MRDGAIMPWVDRYHRDGYYAPIRVLSADEAHACRARLETWEATRGALRGDLRHRAHVFLVWLDELVRDARILDAVEAVLGENLLVWSSSFFIKDARDGARVPWHQDSRAFGGRAADVVTAWVALTDSTPENGALQAIPGSHRRGELVHALQPVPGNLLTRLPETALDVDAAAAASVLLRAGEMSLHHSSLVHGSPPNRTDDRRIGIAIRYVRPSAGRAIGRREPALLVRGVDAGGAFEPLPRPERDAAPEALARHAELMRPPDRRPVVRIGADSWPRAVALRGTLLARDGRGLLVCGPSGSGTSALAGALARRGWRSMERDRSEGRPGPVTHGAVVSHRRMGRDGAAGRIRLSAILLLGRASAASEGTVPAAMPPAHALLGLLPHRSGTHGVELGRGIHELEPLATAVPVYDAAIGSDLMVDAVMRGPDDPPLGRHATIWAEVHEAPASRPAGRAGEDMEAIHE